MFFYFFSFSFSLFLIFSLYFAFALSFGVHMVYGFVFLILGYVFRDEWIAWPTFSIWNEPGPIHS
jgi:hypothetical protein